MEVTMEVISSSSLGIFLMLLKNVVEILALLFSSLEKASESRKLDQLKILSDIGEFLDCVDDIQNTFRQ